MNGQCYCATGMTGPRCNTSCPAGQHGENCLKNCSCQNGGTCNRGLPVRSVLKPICLYVDLTGIVRYIVTCSCRPGYNGTNCEQSCSYGTYGIDCASTCQCMNGASCSTVDGSCICSKGWAGTTCGMPCPPGSYGLDCTERCLCENGASCNRFDGSCVCKDHWTGQYCEIRKTGFPTV